MSTETTSETATETPTTSAAATPFQPYPTPNGSNYDQPRHGGLAAAIRLGLGLGA
jgi:hypothetical protein